MTFDTIAFIALILVAGFFRWIAKQAENAKRTGGNDARKEAIPRHSAEQTDEERVRRFLEALGQPTSRPPPRIERPAARPPEKRAVVPRHRTILSPLPPLTTAPPPLPIEVEKAIPAAPPPAVVPEVARVGVPLVSAKAKFPEPAATLFPETTERAATFPEIRTLLSSERGLRDAIILREIFGPPRSLQTLEF